MSNRLAELTTDHEQTARVEARVENAIPRSRRGALTAISIYIGILPLANHQILSVSLRSTLQSYRPLVFCVLVLVAARFWGKRPAYRLNTSMHVAYVFSACLISNQLLSGSLSYGEIILHLAWPAVFFWGIPRLVPKKSDMKYLSDRVAVVMALSAIGVCGFWYVSGGSVISPVLGANRVALGFENTNVLAQALQVVIIAVLTSAAFRREKRPSEARVIALLVLLSTASMLTGASNVFLFAVGFGVGWWFFLVRRSLGVGVLAFGLLTATLFGFIATDSLASLNGNSSGRIGVWSEHLQSEYGAGNPNRFESLTIGAAEASSGEARGYTTVDDQRFRAGARRLDNTWLNLVVLGGILGAAAVLLSWTLVVRRALSTDDRVVRRLLAGISVGFIAQASVVSFGPTFSNAVVLVFVLIMVPSAAQING